MKKLVRYLKPYVPLMVLCVALVFTQAMCDLKLPDYMSEVVNVGILRSGIEDAVPLRLGRDTYDTLLAFMPAGDAELAARYYAADPAAAEIPQVVYRVPEGVSRGQAKADRQQLDSAFNRAFTVEAAIGYMARGASSSTNPTEAELALIRGNLIRQITQVLDADQRAALIDSMLSGIAAQGGQQNSGQMATLNAMAESGQIAGMALQAEYRRIGVDLTAVQRANLFKTGGKMLGMALAVCLAAVGGTLLAARVAAGFARDLRQRLFEKVAGFSNAQINAFSTASLITRTTNDVTQVQQVITMMLRMLIYAPSMGVGGILYAVSKSPSLSWIIALAVLILLGVMGLLMAFVMPRFKRMQKLTDRLTQITRENISGVMVSRAYNAQSFEIGRFDTANRDLTRNFLFVMRAMVGMMPFIGLIMNGVMLLILWFGARQISASTLQVGDMMAYMQYAMHVVMSFMFVGMMLVMLPRAAVSAERIGQVLSSENEIADPPDPVSPQSMLEQRGLVELNGVSFRYPGAERDALQDITFTARPGQMTAIIGATGSGKTTLMQLILRFYDVTAGQVRVSGVDVRRMRQSDLRAQMGYAPQKGVLFSGTIAENIGLGAPEADPAQLERAAETAQATEFIREKEGGMEEFIAQGGTNVSGGQRQRLAIARALAPQAPILLFDDSFSALDFKTDAALRQALRTRAKDATLIVVAQRVGSIRNAQQIIVLDEGRMVGVGTHRELMQNCPIYRDIARSQLREEELDA